jgi:hypothetical protein
VRIAISLEHILSIHGPLMTLSKMYCEAATPRHTIKRNSTLSGFI